MSPYTCLCKPAGSIKVTAGFKLPWQFWHFGEFRDIHFSDARNGVSVGQDFYGFFTTTDGGETWTLQNRSGMNCYKLAFSGDTGIAISGPNQAQFTYDGGRTFFKPEWTQPRSDFNLNDYFMINRNKIFAVGLDGNIFKTTDGGISWIKCEGFTFPYYLYSITGTKSNILYTCGQNGEVIKSSNGGEIWEVQTTPVYQDLKIIYFLDNDFGFAGGNLGNLIRTTNGGTTWETVHSGLKFGITGIYFATQKTGFIVSYAGEIAKTNDGGLTWKLLNIDSYNNVYDMYKM